MHIEKHSGTAVPPRVRLAGPNGRHPRPQATDRDRSLGRTARAKTRSAVARRPNANVREIGKKSATRPAPTPGRDGPCDTCDVKTTELTIQTGGARGCSTWTELCEQFVAGEGDGLLTVFVPHATAGVVVIELGAGSART